MRSITHRRVMATPRPHVPHARRLRRGPFRGPQEVRRVVHLLGRSQGMPDGAPQSALALAVFAAQYVGVPPAVPACAIEGNKFAAEGDSVRSTRRRGAKGTMMKKEVAAILTCCLGACAQPPAPQQQTMPSPAAVAPPPETAASLAPRVTSEAQIAPGRWDVSRVRCSDLLGAADDDREAAIMFYYGYLAARAGIRVIDVSQIDANVRKVMDRCAAAPNITVPQAFREELGHWK
jgi:HdeA/HdeB family